MLAIQIDDRGLWTLSLEDSKGERHDYAVKRIAAGLDAFALELRRLDTGATYRVGIDRAGVPRCTCPDYRYRRKDGVRWCKHCLPAKSLKRLLDELASVERAG